MRPYQILLAILILSFHSCTRQKATITASESVHSGAYDVYPGWTEEYSESNKYIPLGVAVGAATYGYLREPITVGEEQIGNSLTAIALGLAGYFITSSITRSFSGDTGKKIPYQRSQSRQWMDNYNLNKGTDYKIINDPYAYPIRIVPYYLEHDYLLKEAELQEQLEIKQKKEQARFDRLREIERKQKSGDPDIWDKYIHSEDDLIGTWNMENGYAKVIFKRNYKAIYIDQYGNETDAGWYINSAKDYNSGAKKPYLHLECCLGDDGSKRFEIIESPKNYLVLTDENTQYKPYLKDIENRHQGIPKEDYDRISQYFIGQWKATVMLAILPVTVVMELKEDGSYYANNSYNGSAVGKWYIHYDEHNGKRFFYLTIETPKENGRTSYQRYAIDANSILINSFSSWPIDQQVSKATKYQRIDNIEDYSSNIGGAVGLGAIVLGAIIEATSTEQSARNLSQRSNDSRIMRIWQEEEDYNLRHGRRRN